MSNSTGRNGRLVENQSKPTPEGERENGSSAFQTFWFLDTEKVFLLRIKPVFDVRGSFSFSPDIHNISLKHRARQPNGEDIYLCNKQLVSGKQACGNDIAEGWLNLPGRASGCTKQACTSQRTGTSQAFWHDVWCPMAIKPQQWRLLIQPPKGFSRFFYWPRKCSQYKVQ